MILERICLYSCLSTKRKEWLAIDIRYLYCMLLDMISILLKVCPLLLLCSMLFLDTFI